MGKQTRGITTKDREWLNKELKRLHEVNKELNCLSKLQEATREQLHKIRELRTTRFIIETALHQFCAGSPFKTQYLYSKLKEQYEHIRDYLPTN